MNEAMIAVGVLILGYATYKNFDANDEIQRELARRDEPTDDVDLGDHPGLFRRYAILVAILSLIGGLTVAWGVLDWGTSDLVFLHVFLLGGFSFVNWLTSQ